MGKILDKAKAIPCDCLTKKPAEMAIVIGNNAAEVARYCNAARDISIGSCLYGAIVFDGQALAAIATVGAMHQLRQKDKELSKEPDFDYIEEYLKEISERAIFEIRAAKENHLIGEPKGSA